MAFVELDPKSVAIFRAIAGPVAEKAIQQGLLPHLQAGLKATSASLPHLREAFESPLACLQVFYTQYAFAKRGREREELSRAALSALRKLGPDAEFSKVLAETDGERFWNAFCQVAEERKLRNSEALNLGLILGMLELAQEIYRLDGIGSIAGWVIKGVLTTQRIEPQFERIVDIRGVGPKTTSTLLRDLVLVFGVEDQLDNVDRLYVQPVDKWIREFAEYLVPELREERSVDWVVAGKVSKYARHAGVSGIRFNLGATYFGIREVFDPSRLEPAIKSLLRSLESDRPDADRPA